MAVIFSLEALNLNGQNFSEMDHCQDLIAAQALAIN